jgi:hypothetical protein
MSSLAGSSTIMKRDGLRIGIWAARKLFAGCTYIQTTHLFTSTSFLHVYRRLSFLCLINVIFVLISLCIVAPRRDPRTLPPCAKVRNLWSFAAEHIATRLLSKGTVFCKLGMYPERVLEHIASRWTILFLETIVYFHSYERYKGLHTGRMFSRPGVELHIGRS